MTRYSRPSLRQLSRYSRPLAVIVTAFVLSPLACDSVAEITFHNEMLVEIVPAGLENKACQTDKKATASLRFTVLTSSDTRLEPGQNLAHLDQVLTPGQNFTAENLLFSEAWLFAIDETGSDKLCTKASDCEASESCLNIERLGLGEYYYAPGSYCVIPTQLEVLSPPRFEHFERILLDDNPLVTTQNASGRSFAFVLDNSATLDGSDQSGSPDAERASDPLQYRKVGLMGFVDALEQGDDALGRLEFMTHFANGQGKIGVYSPSEDWLGSLPLWQNKVLESYPTPSGQSPIWEAVLASVEAIIHDAKRNYAPHLLVFTDGPAEPQNDGAMEAFDIAFSGSNGIDSHWLDYRKSGQAPTLSYAKLAKKHCINYHFLNDASEIPRLMRQIAINTRSHWTSELQFSLPPAKDRVYRLATTMVITLGGQAVSYAAQRILEHNDVSDRRFIVVH